MLFGPDGTGFLSGLDYTQFFLSGYSNIGNAKSEVRTKFQENSKQGKYTNTRSAFDKLIREDDDININREFPLFNIDLNKSNPDSAIIDIELSCDLPLSCRLVALEGFVRQCFLTVQIMREVMPPSCNHYVSSALDACLTTLNLMSLNGNDQSELGEVAYLLMQVLQDLPTNVASTTISSLFPHYYVPLAPTTDSLGLSQVPYVNCYSYKSDKEKPNHFRNRNYVRGCLDKKASWYDESNAECLKIWYRMMTSSQSQYDQRLRSILLNTWVILFNDSFPFKPIDEKSKSANSANITDITSSEALSDLFQSYCVPSRHFPIHPSDSLTQIEIATRAGSYYAYSPHKNSRMPQSRAVAHAFRQQQHSSHAGGSKKK
jgi:hypothetical protein